MLSWWGVGRHPACEWVDVERVERSHPEASS